MIKIGKSSISVDQASGLASLCAEVQIDQSGYRLRFSVERKWAGCLSIGRADAFVMALLPFAMRNSQEIICEDAMSDCLRFKICEYLIPALTMEGDNPYYHSVQIKAPLTNERYPNLGAVGMDYEDREEAVCVVNAHGQGSEYPLTHIVGCGIGGSDHDKEQRAKAFAQKHNLIFLGVDTNLGEILQEKYEEVCSFRRFSCALALQGLFSVYLSIFDCGVTEFKLDIDDCTKYELLTANCASTESMAVYAAGMRTVMPDKDHAEVGKADECKGKGGDIRIGTPYIIEKDSTTRLSVKVLLHGKEQVLWIAVKEEYKSYLVQDRVDAFLVALLAMAMRERSDIICEAPVTRRLLYQINHYLIPGMSSGMDEYHRITVYAEPSDQEIESLGGVVTGWTGGVDSMFTLLRNSREPEDSAHRLNYLMITNNGAIEGTDPSDTFQKMVQKAQNGIIRETDFRMVGIDSNLQAVLQENFLAVQTLRYAAVMLALQKLFAVFLLSASYAFKRYSLRAEDMSYYELFVLGCCTTDSLRMYSSGGAFSRLQKITLLTDFPLAYRYLHPCIYALRDNCGECKKCYALQGALYALGKLELFSKVYDVEKFKEHKDEYFTNIVSRKSESNICREIVELCYRKGINLSVAERRATLRKIKKQIGLIRFLKKRH